MIPTVGEGGRLGWLRWSAIALLALALAVGMLLPVYTDEVGWRFQERAGFDGVDKLYTESCGLGTIVRPPLFMMPVRWYSAIFNGAFADPFWVRVSGVLYALVWLAMLIVLIRRIAPDRATRDRLTVVGCALAALGMMPLLLVWSRPEQPILLAITGAVLLALRPAPSKTRSAPEWLNPIAVLALAIVALSYHFKALLLVPAFAACIWFTARRPGYVPRFVALLLLAGVTWAATDYWFARLACPDDPVLTAQRAEQSLGLALLVHDGGVWGAVKAVIGNLKLHEYVELAAPSAQPMSDWVPVAVSKATQKLWRRLLLLAWGLALLLALRTFAIAGWRAARARRLDPRLVMAVLLTGAACGWTASQVIRNVYEVSFVLPLMLLAMLLTLATEHAGRALTVLALALGIALPVSLVAIGVTYGPALTAAFGQRGYLDRQPHSLAVRGYAAEKPAILAAAGACGIRPEASPASLLVDELTYFAFIGAPLPQHHLGILPPQSRGVITDPIAYLESRRSGGMIIGCRNLPDHLAARAKRTGEFCCLAPPKWGAQS